MLRSSSRADDTIHQSKADSGSVDRRSAPFYDASGWNSGVSEAGMQSSNRNSKRLVLGSVEVDAEVVGQIDGLSDELEKVWMLHLSHNTLHLTPHTSYTTPHTTPHTQHLTHNTSHTTPHTSHLTPHTSHLTPHTSHTSIHRSRVRSL
jgi:hypothetical protein